MTPTRDRRSSDHPELGPGPRSDRLASGPVDDLRTVDLYREWSDGELKVYRSDSDELVFRCEWPVFCLSAR